MSYTSQTVPSTYNQAPPPDDGSTSAANRVSWATIKTKLTDPLKTFVESVNTAIAAAFTSVENFTVVGAVMPYAGSTAPTNWLFCDGSAISRTTYADLFAIISDTYGVGDGSTTFNLPDVRGRVVAGRDKTPESGGSAADRLTDQSGGLDGETLGDAGGAETHTLTPSEGPIRNHTHSAANITTAEGGANSVLTNASGTAHFTGNPAGGEQNGAAHNNVQPTIILNYIIYAGA